MRPSHKKLLTFVIVLLVLFLGECYFFRYMILSNFDGLVGDAGDSKFNMLVCEHWYEVFQGNESVRDLRVFYPQQNTLGYSDTFFAYAIPYSLLRATGIDMLGTMQLVLILFHVLGSIGLFLLLKFKLKRSTSASIFGTLMFALANNYFVKSGHTQMFIIGLIPWFFILIYGFYENINKVISKRIIYGVSAIFMMGLVTFSDFYIAYFTMLFMVILFGVLCVLAGKADEKPISKIYHFIRNNLLEVFIYIITSIVVLLPSVWVYLPVIHQTGPRPLSEVMTMLPIWSDFFNVSFNNLVWGDLLKILFPKPRPMSGELATGFPFVTLLAFLSCVVYFWRKFKNKAFQFNTRLPLAIGVSVLLVMLLILRIFDSSLWTIIYTLVPGTSALRAVSRYNMFLSLPIGIVLAFGADVLLSKWKKIKSVKIILISVLLIFFLLENTITTTNSNWSISEQREQIRRVSSPPENCKVFVFLNESENTGQIIPYIYQLDAWMIAIKFDQYTINGYSGNFPHGWDGIWDPNNALNYYTSIQAWAQKNNISDICTYDPTNNKWTSTIPTK